MPTVLPAYEPSPYHQGELLLDGCEGERRDISPGVVLVSGWLTPNEQNALVDYSRTADDTDGALVKPLPPRIARLGRRAVADTFGSSAGCEFEPDAVIANLYAPGARLGLHQDAEEPSPAPVVTISIGDTCLFRIAGVKRRTSPIIDIHLHSGDLLVFGGPSRRMYHGVPKVYDNTGPRIPGLAAGRLSLTIRETGLAD